MEANLPWSKSLNSPKKLPPPNISCHGQLTGHAHTPPTAKIKLCCACLSLSLTSSARYGFSLPFIKAALSLAFLLLLFRQQNQRQQNAQQQKLPHTKIQQNTLSSVHTALSQLQSCRQRFPQTEYAAEVFTVQTPFPPAAQPTPFLCLMRALRRSRDGLKITAGKPAWSRSLVFNNKVFWGLKGGSSYKRNITFWKAAVAVYFASS